MSYFFDNPRPAARSTASGWAAYENSIRRTILAMVEQNKWSGREANLASAKARRIIAGGSLRDIAKFDRNLKQAAGCFTV